LKSVCMVNDCSHVAENLIPHLKNWFEVSCVKRTRSLMDKTVGLWWKIRNSDADLYHVHYALQDAWITQKIRSLDVLHCHGSDIRVGLNHIFYSRIVKSNLQKARRVLYATPDMVELKRYREDAEYMPTPVDTSMFYPHPLQTHENLQAVYFNKWYEKLPQKIVDFCKRNNVDLHVLTANVPFHAMPTLLNAHDIFIDRFTIPSLSKTALEAMACGLNVICYDTEDLEAQVMPRTADPTVFERFRGKHEVTIIAHRLKRIYEELMED